MKSIYGIELFFDKKFDEYMRSLWDLADKKGTSTFFRNIKGVEPHIAIAVYEGISKESIINKFAKFKETDISASPIYFPSVSIFKSTNVTYLNPVPSAEVLNYINLTHNFFDDFSDNCLQYYKASYVMPHATVGKNDNIEQAKRNFEVIIDAFKPQTAIVDRIALVEIIYENDVCTECVTLDYKKLNTASSTDISKTKSNEKIKKVIAKMKYAEFKKSFRGYAPDDIDKFFDKMTSMLNQVYNNEINAAEISDILNPKIIRKAQFHQKLLGYDTALVDRFLNDLENDFSAIAKLYNK